METEFTPLASLGGGVLIGLAAVALMALHGRIAGATGVLSGAVAPSAPDERGWRLAMIAGMVVGAFALVATVGVEFAVPVSAAALVLGGLIVGVGTGLANGCTSGHGVCGLARLSRRSLVAVATFMAAAGLTVFVVRHMIGG